MSKLKTYKQLLEADLYKNKGVTPEYLKDIKDKAVAFYGDTGFNNSDMMEMGNLIHDIVKLQQGNEEELTKIAEQIIMDEYGTMLDGIVLDLKIVRPDDSEKREMVSKTKQNPLGNDADNPITTDDGTIINLDLDEVDKRKLLNNITQGESQNIHTLIHNKRDEINEIADGLVEKSLRFLELNNKGIWDAYRPSLAELIMANPDMANMVEIYWTGEEIPTIKVRALDITMILHEAVKGIYELIMANAIPVDSAMAEAIIAETDTLRDEDEDVKYGTTIAADLRDYTNRFLGENYPDTKDIPNIREFVYGGLAKMKAKLFLDFMKKVLTGDTDSADRILKNENIVENIMKEFDEYANPTDDDLYIDKEDNNILDYSDMSPSELQSALDAAIDDGDFETAEEIGKFL